MIMYSPVSALLSISDVHPRIKNLYFWYRTSCATLLGKFQPVHVTWLFDVSENQQSSKWIQRWSKWLFSHMLINRSDCRICLSWVKPPPKVFTRNTRDSSDVNPESKTQRLSQRELVNTNRGWFEWLVPLLAYKLTSCFLPLPYSLFYQTGTLCRATSGSGSLILLVVSQQTSHWSLCAFCMPADLSACAVGTGRLLIARSIYNITVPANARTEPGYK